MSEDLKTQLDQHAQILINNGIDQDYVYEFLAYDNVNLLSAFSLVGEMTLNKDEQKQIEKSLPDFQTRDVPELSHGLKGGKFVQKALAIIFTELAFISDNDEEITETTVICLNYVKLKNPSMKRLTIAMNYDEDDHDDLQFEYEVSHWK